MKYKSNCIIAIFLSFYSIASAQNVIWIGDDPDNANWSNADNWQDGTVPDSNLYSAFFRSDKGSTRTVVVDDDYTIKRIAIQQWGRSGSSAFTVDGVGRTLTVDRNEGNSLAGIYAQGDASHTINSDVVIYNSKASSTAYTRIASDDPSKLIINGAITAETKTEFSSTGNIECTGSIINNSEIRFSQDGGSMSISGSGTASGVGLLTFSSGIVNLNRSSALSGDKIFVGTTTINFSAQNAIASVNDLTVTGNASINFNDATQVFAMLDLAGSEAVLAISLGTNSKIAFADSSALPWKGTLAVTLSGASSLRFGKSASALTAAQLEKITVNGGNARLDPSGYLTALP